MTINQLRRMAGLPPIYKKHEKKFSYKWYLAYRYVSCDADGVWYPVGRPHVFRAKNREAAEQRMAGRDNYESMMNDTGSAYSPFYYTDIVGEYEAKEQALADIPNQDRIIAEKQAAERGLGVVGRPQ